MNNTVIIGAMLVLVGAAALVGGSLASEAIQSDRAALFTVTEDDTIVAASETDEVVRNPGRGNPATIATVTNNFDETMIVDFSLELESDSILLYPEEQESDGLTLYPDDSKAITARCATPDEGGQQEKGTVDLVISIDKAQGDSIGVEDMTVTIPVEYDCVGVGPGENGASGQAD